MQFSTIRFMALAALFVSLPINGQQDFRQRDDDLAVDSAPLSYLVFDPPNLKIDDYSVGGKIRVRLSAPPRQATKVYYEAPSLSFTSCALDFDQNNWDKWQEVRSVAMPYMTEASVDREFKMRFVASCPGGNLHGRAMDYAVTRGPGKGATCTSSGDPHYKTFDGHTYDFMGIGCYQLVRAGFLTIQTVTTQWGNTAASVNKSVAIRYGRAVYLIDAVTGKSCDDGGQDLSNIKLIESQNGRDFHFQFPEGTEVKVTIQDGSPKYLDLTVIASGHLYGNTKGLCGTFSGQGADDFTGPNGENFNNASQFGEAWKCPERDNLFQCGSRCVGAKDYLLQPCNLCSIPKGLAGSGVVRDIPAGYRPTSSHNWPTYRPIPMPQIDRLPPPPVCPPEFLRDAELRCSQVFKLPGITNLVKTQDYVRSCIKDAKLTCSLAFLDGLKSTCLSQARAVTKSLQYDVASVEGMRHGRDVARLYGLGNNACPRSCSGRGECFMAGCKCAPGYTGLSCEIDLGRAFRGAQQRTGTLPFNNNTRDFFGRRQQSPIDDYDNGTIDEDYDGEE